MFLTAFVLATYNFNYLIWQSLHRTYISISHIFSAHAALMTVIVFPMYVLKCPAYSVYFNLEIF